MSTSIIITKYITVKFLGSISFIKHLSFCICVAMFVKECAYETIQVVNRVLEPRFSTLSR